MTHKARPNDSKREGRCSARSRLMPLDKEYVMSTEVRNRLVNQRDLVELLCWVCHKPIVVGDVVVPRKSFHQGIVHKKCNFYHARHK